MNTVHIKIDTCRTYIYIYIYTYTMNQAHVTSGWWNPHVTHGSRWPVVAPAIGPWDPGSLVRSNRRILEIYANWYIHVYTLICIYTYVYVRSVYIYIYMYIYINVCIYIYYMYIVFISVILVYRTFVWWLRAMFSSKKRRTRGLHLHDPSQGPGEIQSSASAGPPENPRENQWINGYPLVN